jgi:hypothetical protein
MRELQQLRQTPTPNINLFASTPLRTTGPRQSVAERSEHVRRIESVSSAVKITIGVAVAIRQLSWQRGRSSHTS